MIFFLTAHYLHPISPLSPSFPWLRTGHIDSNFTASALPYIFSEGGKARVRVDDGIWQEQRLGVAGDVAVE